MAQLSQAIDGIAEACNALGTPVTGGNVSLYNETKGEGIYPTPVLGVVGIIEDVTKSVPSGFQALGDSIMLLYAADRQPLTVDERKRRFIQLLGCSEFARSAFGIQWGRLSSLDLRAERQLNELLSDFSRDELIRSAADVGSGGLAVCLARCGATRGYGADVEPSVAVDGYGPDRLDALSVFIETPGTVVLTCDPSQEEEVSRRARMRGLVCIKIGSVIEKQLRIRATDGCDFLSVDIESLLGFYHHSLEFQLAAEVVTA
jgi:phosphoribosylformylglycinamidine synthase